MLEYSVPTELSGLRLDKALSQLLENVSRNQIQKAIKSSCVQINNVIILDSDILVKENDIILFSFKEPEELTIEAADIKLDIVYEDEDLIVINKAAGMSTQGQDIMMIRLLMPYSTIQTTYPISVHQKDLE